MTLHQVETVDRVDGQVSSRATVQELRERVRAASVLVPAAVGLVILPSGAAEGDPAWCGLLVRDPRVIDLLCELYEGIWDYSAPVGPGGAEVPLIRDLTDRQERIGRLLATGAKDEAIARRLGVSLRTVRSEISRLTEALGARSRFQAGVQLARRYG